MSPQFDLRSLLERVEAAPPIDAVEAVAEEHRDAFTKELSDFIDGLVSHYVLDDGKIVVAHAGMKESMQGRGSGKVREFALYGETTGETDEFGRTLYEAGGDANPAINAAVETVAKARGIPMVQVALAWVLQQQPVTAPIIGATKLNHISDAVAAVDVVLTPEEIAAVEAPYRTTGFKGF